MDGIIFASFAANDYFGSMTRFQMQAASNWVYIVIRLEALLLT